MFSFLEATVFNDFLDQLAGIWLAPPRKFFFGLGTGEGVDLLA